MLWSVVVLAFVVATGAVNLPGVPSTFTGNNQLLSAISDDVARKFGNEYVNFLKTGVESASLRQISAQLASSHSKKDFFTKDISELGSADEFFVCTTCRATVNVVSRMLREDDGELNGPDAEELTKRILLDVCERLNMQTSEVCEGMIDVYFKNVHHIIMNSEVDSRTFCSLFMEWSFCNVKNMAYNWTLSIDANGAPLDGPKSDVPSKTDGDLHVLHLTDIHYDPLYEPGALAECEEPLCCQRHKDLAQGTSKAAGYWGDYRDCDLPWHTVQNALEHIQQTHPKIDYIYQTGDIVDHMMWATSPEKNIESLSKVNNKLAELFPNTPVYPCIGNHESHPGDLFSPDYVPDDVNTRWLYEYLYKDWSRWLPESTKETIMLGGYYTVSPRSGFRVIAVNNNDCYTRNFWLFYSGATAKPQLQWLHDTLLAAEKAGEHVHILAHLPSGDSSCWSVWSREYNAIIIRFRNTISGIFNGHTHKDELSVHYTTGGHAVALSFNGGSLTTFSEKNPNYVIYQMEPKRMQVVDYDTWISNLAEDNQHGEDHAPVWFKEYTFSEEFTDNVSPAGFDALLEKMAEHPELLRKFWRFKITSAEHEIKNGCDRNCLANTLCGLATTVNDQKDRCRELQEKLHVALDNESTTSTTSSTTSMPTTSPTEAPTTPGDDGAASIVAMSMSSIVALFVAIKYIF